MYVLKSEALVMSEFDRLFPILKRIYSLKDSDRNMASHIYSDGLSMGLEIQKKKYQKAYEGFNTDEYFR